MGDPTPGGEHLTPEQTMAALLTLDDTISDFEKVSLSRHDLQRRAVEELRRLGIELVGPIENPTALRYINPSESGEPGGRS